MLIDEKLIEFMNTIPFKKIDGKKLEDYFIYKDIRLWWLLRPAIYPRLRKILLKEEESKYKTFGKKIYRNIYFDYKDTIRNLLFKITSKTTFKKKSIIILSATRYWQKTLDYYTLNEIKDDIIFNPIIRKLSKEYKVSLTLIDTDYTPSGDYKVSHEKFMKGWIPIESFYNRNIRKEANEGYKIIREEWEHLKNNKDFINLFKIDGKEFHQEAIKELDFIFSKIYLIPILKVINAKERIFDLIEPQALVATYETGFYAKALIYEAKKRGIPSFGVQHGALMKINADYIFTRGDISPDYTLVYGKYAQEFLVEKKKYPKESIIIVGAPRYDVLTKLDKIYGACIDEIIEKFGISDYILVDSSVLIKNNELIRVLKKFENNIIVKVHPSQNKKMFKFKNVSKDFNIIKLIYFSKAIITACSTIAIESLTLGKPVLIIMFGSEYYKYGPYYEDEELFYLIKSPVELTKVLEKILTEDIKINEDLKRKFEIKYLSYIGRSTERTCKIIIDKVKMEDNL